VKIAVISGTLPPFPCGVGKHTDFLARALVKDSQDVTVFTLNREDVGNNVSGYKVRKEIEHFGFSDYLSLARKLKSEDFHLVHLEYPTKLNKRGVSIVVLPWLMKLFGLRTVLTLHELTGSSPFGKVRNILLSLGFDRVIVTNLSDKKYLRVLPKKIRVVPIGPTLNATYPKVRRKSGLVAHLGFLDGSKGEDLLIESFSKLTGNYSLLFLTTYTETNPQHLMLSRKISQYHLNKQVRFLNPKSDQDIAGALSSAEIAVLPFRGGVGARNSTLLEALTFGLPTIVTIGKDSPGYLKDGVNCLFTTEDVNSIRQSITKLHLDPKLREKISRGAKQLAKNFDWAAIARRTASVYREIVG